MRRQLDALTGLRFFAALLVVVHHFAPKTNITFLDNIAARSFVAVTFFFILSGFILAYSYMDERGELRVTRKSFWHARFARIYPIYILGLILAAPRVLYHGHDTSSTMLAASAAAYIGLLQAWHTEAFKIWNAPGWSLSAEAFFYITFPFIAPWLVRLSRERVQWLLGLTWFLVSTLCVVALLLDPSLQTMLRFNPLLRLPEFVLGIALYRLWATRPRAGWLHEYRAGIAAVGLIGLFGFLGYGIDRMYYFNAMTAPIILISLYCIASLERNDNSGLARFLASKPVVQLGEASFALYILHVPIWDYTSFILTRLFAVPDNGIVVFSVTLPIAVLISRLAYVYIEHPLNRYLRKQLIPAIEPGAQPV